MMGNRGILAVSLGAAKSGTSWLFDQLAGHPEVHAPSTKEQHFFNSLGETRAARIGKLQVKLAKYDGRNDAFAVKRAEEIKSQISLLKDGSDDAYLKHVSKGSSAKKVAMDFPPAYGLLPSATLMKIQSIANAKFVFLMRDPVDRLWSNIRMDAARASTRENDFAQNCQEMLARVFKDRKPAIQLRGDYAGMIQRFAVLDPRRVFTAFYEELFTNETITRICDFLEISAAQMNFGKRVNESRAYAMANSDRERAAEYLKPQYAAVQAHMGRLPDSWKQNAGVA